MRKTRAEEHAQDAGTPFFPLQVPHPDPEAPLESRAKGGLGDFFVRNVMVRVEYQREDRCSIATLTKRTACTASS